MNVQVIGVWTPNFSLVVNMKSGSGVKVEKKHKNNIVKKYILMYNNIHLLSKE